MKMIMKLTVAGILMTGGLFAQTIAGRELRQQERIGQGVRSGELTRGETRSLERRERSVAREVRRDRRSGGGLSAAERQHIAARQDRISHAIYRDKHNGRVR